MLYLGESYVGMPMVQAPVDQEFTIFVKDVGRRLAVALTAAYGPEVGRECTADALAYGWEHWGDLRDMDNPAGYLYRVGQSAARRYRRHNPLFPTTVTTGLPHVEPGLPAAMASLTEAQRTAVALVHAFEWSEREAAIFLGVHRSTVRRHCERGLSKLRAALEAHRDR